MSGLTRATGNKTGSNEFRTGSNEFRTGSNEFLPEVQLDVQPEGSEVQLKVQQAKEETTMAPELATVLLVMALGFGLWLYAVLPGNFSATSTSPGTPLAQYRWLAEPGQPAGIYRISSPTKQILGDNWIDDWTREGPPHLAVFSLDPLPLNRVDAQTLTLLPGIGPALARRIIQYRENHGPFSSSEELIRVHGIGPKTMERIRSLVTID